MLCGALLLAAAVLCRARAGGVACGVAEFSCRNGHCVRPDAYCDGTDHCGDGSDEPPHCSVCNRTYYGRAGDTYSLRVGGSEPPRAPFLCHLTLTAGGGALGDLVQLAFEEFLVGRYEPRALDGCPDGFMQLSELGRPFTGGSWCGEAGGYAAYYSETSTVTASVKLFRARLGAAFRFRVRYKFLARRDAVVRFGSGTAPLERGAVSPGTYCTRTFEECHRKPCRLQSPNYPGMYPRNVSCYWSLRQKDVPTCKHAMISVRQDHAHKMQIKRSISMASLNKTGRAVRAWSDCTGERDRLIFYDGGTTLDPVLVEYCGGDWLPPVVSRGPDMLVAFHSSPYSAPLPSASPLRGFELDVDVVFADSDSLDYAREAKHCEFHVKASSSEDESDANANALGAGRGRRGRLHAPAHTLPPDTTCTWTFHGRPGDLVWIYFSSYTQYSLVEPRRTDANDADVSTERADRYATPPAELMRAGDSSPWARLRDMLRAKPVQPPTTPPPARNASCATVLRIWDGGGDGEPDARLLGRYCDGPAVCARASLANATRVPRACGRAESYVSTGALLAMSARSRPGTATHPLRFALHYEFVDTRLAGEALDEPLADSWPPECARVVTTPGLFQSPRNVLWFGRGGARRLRCVFRIRAPPQARVSLSLLSASFGARSHCITKAHPHTGLPTCVSTAAGAINDDSFDYEQWDWEWDHEDRRAAMLRLYDVPWPGYRVPIACICDNSSWTEEATTGAVSDATSNARLELLSGGGAIELELVAKLRAREDHRHVRFSASWSPVPAPCPPRRLGPPGARMRLTSPDRCGPTLLEARPGRAVFLRVWGSALGPEERCPAGVVLVFGSRPTRLLSAVCPGPEDGPAEHVYSGAWRGGDERALVVSWRVRSGSVALFSWMEVWVAPNASCTHRCPGLGACAGAALWCDGRADCPSGADEAGPECGGARRLLARLGGARAAGGAAAALAVALVLLVAAAWAARRGVAPDKRVSARAALFGSASSTGS